MKKMIKTKKGQIVWSLTVTLVTWTTVFSFYCYDQNRKQKIYESIKLFFKDDTTLEYGNEKYDPLDFIKKASGNVHVLSTKVDLKQVGKQKVIYEVEKENITKQFTIDVDVQDTKLPEIVIKEEEISLYVGETYDGKENIESVKDPVDGDIPYIEQIEENTKNAYSILGEVNFNQVGEYTLNVVAIDKNEGKSEKSFKIKISEKPIPLLPKVTNYSNNAPTSDVEKIKQIASSFVGTPYVFGGTTPDGFDCSGFVMYVYAQIGKSLPRTASGQATYGQNIERQNLMIGDILVWSSNGTAITHTSIYIGDGNMVHAANPRKGVIISNMDAWPDQLYVIKRP